MSKERPDHHDAEIVLKLYDLRREPVMRASRDVITAKFWPKSFDELIAITKPDHAMNAAWRQVTSYWEVAYSFVKHGAIHAELSMESLGEGLIPYVKVERWLPQYREQTSQLAFKNAEWIVANTERGKALLPLFKKRFAPQLGG